MIVSFTFDDGNLSQIHDFFPTLRKHAFPATFYVVGSQIGMPGKLSEENLRALISEGNEIGSHGWTHRSLLRMGPTDLKDELRRSLEALRPFGAKTFAYPYGYYNRKVALEVSHYFDSARAYAPTVVANTASSIQRYALNSFSVEGRFQSRIDPQARECILSQTAILNSSDWLILTFHGRTSVRFARKAIFEPANVTREQARGYINDIRERFSSTRRNLVSDFQVFCARLAEERVTVTTVSSGLERLL